jgi:hypothetical protein
LRDDEVRPPRQIEPDDDLGPRPAVLQQPGERACPIVQRAVGQGLAGAVERGGTGRRGGAILEDLVY